MAQNIIEIIIKAIDNTKSGLTTPITSLKTLETSLSKLSVAFGISAAGTAVFFEQLVSHSIEAAASLESMSEKTGISVETLSTLKYAAQQTHTDIDGLAIGLKKMSATMLAAGQGNQKAVAAFESLGVSVKNSDGSLKSENEVMLEVATAFSKMQNGAEKSALAVQIFGKSGIDLIPFLNKGADGIGALEAKAKSMGLQVSGETARNAVEFQNSLKQLEDTIQGFGNIITADILPALNVFMQDLNDTGGAAGTANNSLTSMGNILGEIVKGVLSLYFVFKLVFTEVADVIDALTIGFTNVVETLSKVVEAHKMILAGHFQQAKEMIVQNLQATAETEKFVFAQMKTDGSGSIKGLTDIWLTASKTIQNDSNDLGKTVSKNLLLVKMTAADIKKAFDQIHPGTSAFFKEFQQLGTKSYSSVKDAALDLTATMTQTFDQSAKTTVTDLIKGGKSAADAFKQLGDAMVESVVNWIVQMGLAKAEQAAMAALGNAILGSSTAASAAAAAGIGAAWSGPAAAVSLATFGADAGPAQAAILSTAAMSKGAFSSFAVGSDYISQTQMAIVHQGERIVPSKTNQDLTKALNGGSNGGVVHAHIHLNGNEIASAIIDLGRKGKIPSSAFS